MATDDFEENNYGADDDSIASSAIDVADSGKNLYDTVKGDKKGSSKKDKDKDKNKDKEKDQGKDANKQAEADANKQAGQETGKNAGQETGKNAGQETGKNAGQEGGKKASKEGSKKASKEGSKKAAKEGSKKAAKEGSKKAAKEGGKAVAKEGGKAVAKEGGKIAAKEGGKAAVKAAAGTAVKAIPYVGWAIAVADAVITLGKAIHKLKKKIDQKFDENGVNLKGIRRLLPAALVTSPLLLIFVIIIVICLLISLLTQLNTITKTDFLAKAIECAESGLGCEDFENTGVRITPAWEPMGVGIVDNIIVYTESALNKLIPINAPQQTVALSSDFQSKKEQFGSFEKTFDAALSKRLIYFTDLQLARLVIEYLMACNKYYGLSETMSNLFAPVEGLLGLEDGSEDKNFIDWLFRYTS